MGLSASDAILQTRPRWIRIAGQLIAVAAMSSIGACVYEPSGSSLSSILFYGGLAAMLVLAQVSRWATRTARGPLQVDDRGIAVADRVIPAAELPAGVVCDVVDTRGVVIGSRGSTTSIDVAEALLLPLVESLRVHFRARPRFPVHARLREPVSVAVFCALAALIAVTTWLGGLFGFGFGFLAFVGTLLASIAGYRALGRRTLTVGADGIAIRTAIGTQTLIPYSQVQAITAARADVQVHLADGADYVVGFGIAPRGAHLERCMTRAQMLAGILETTREAYVHAAASGETARKASMLERGGRGIGEWMSALRSLNETQASFRSATLQDEDLWRIAEDPTEREPVRVAAAVALRERLDEGGRRRLRLVADACVAPRLRVALDAAVDRDDTSLTQALEELEEPEAAQELGAKSAGRPALTANRSPRTTSR